jgi:alpha,alpha-trehalase
MTDLIETYGYVPNGTRTYYLGRSQPPLYHMMVKLVGEVTPRRLAAMKLEHAWWMAGADDIGPNESTAHVVRLADGSLLNRYWSDAGTPRDESWREDIATARSAPARDPARIYRELRAGAESGWDFSSRWLGDGTLASIRTSAIIPIDLNAFLFSLEMEIAKASVGEDRRRYEALASGRRAAVQRHMWRTEAGYFIDFDIETGKQRPALTAAAATPLLVGIASQGQVAATARRLREDLLAPGGLRTTTVETGQQWDRPNGWAPLQWIAATGLRRYGQNELAAEIARRWVATVEVNFGRTGLIHEKYDVEECTTGGGGEYAPQHGFGWTNGVTADFIDMYGL